MYKLRELERRDMRTINQWRNNPDLIDKLGAPYRYINEEVDEKWFDNYMMNRNNTVRCVIALEDSDVPIGLVSLTNIDYLNQSATFHIMIGDEANQNKGAGIFAIKKILEHAFLDMNMQRVDLSVLSDNNRAIHLYEKMGFVNEGVKRNARYKGGRFVDLYEYSILKNEYINNEIYNQGEVKQR